MDRKFKTQAEYIEDESDIDDEWIVTHEESMKAKDIEKAEKKFKQENEKLEEEGSKPQKPSVLEERLADIDTEYEALASERGTKLAELKRERPAEKVQDAITKLTERISAAKLQIIDRDEGKEIALNTR
jgi:DNA topoisomerase-1